MPRLVPQRQQVASTMRTRWYSPGMLVAGVLILILVLCGVNLVQWWVWVGALIISAVIDALTGAHPVQQAKVKTKREYSRGVQEDDDEV